MRVLVSNDDGVDAPGMLMLARQLASIGDVVVVAPDRDRSGASNSLTLDQPIRVKRTAEDRFEAWLALPPIACTSPCPECSSSCRISIVSGINSAANLGDDVIYSGTVSAAMEGRFLGLPAIAVSLASRDHKGQHYESAAKAVLMLIRRLLVDPLPADTILNVNVPDLPWDGIRGLSVARLGRRHRAPACWSGTSTRVARPMYWIGPPGDAEDDGPGTDFHAVREGYVSITPIHVDLTRYQALEKVGSWVSSLSMQENAA